MTTVVQRPRPVRQRGRLRAAFWTVFGVACAITLLAVVLLVAAYRNDAAINAARGTANATVESIDWSRTIVKFEGPDGVEHRSQDGVLYPGRLHVGQPLRVEYDVRNPNLVRVYGRTAELTLLPLGTTVLFTWAIAGPLLWWLRRSSRHFGG